MDLSRVDLVEKGHEDKRVEDHCKVLRGLERGGGFWYAVVDVEKLRSSEEDGENDGKLVDGVANDVLHHGARDEGLGAAVRLTLEQVLCGRFSGQR